MKSSIIVMSLLLLWLTACNKSEDTGEVDNLSRVVDSLNAELVQRNDSIKKVFYEYEKEIEGIKEGYLDSINVMQKQLDSLWDSLNRSNTQIRRLQNYDEPFIDIVALITLFSIPKDEDSYNINNWETGTEVEALHFHDIATYRGKGMRGGKASISVNDSATHFANGKAVEKKWDFYLDGPNAGISEAGFSTEDASIDISERLREAGFRVELLSCTDKNIHSRKTHVYYYESDEVKGWLRSYFEVWGGGMSHDFTIYNSRPKDDDEMSSDCDG